MIEGGHAFTEYINTKDATAFVVYFDRVPMEILITKKNNIVQNVLPTQYCAGGKIETNEVGRACGAYGGG